MKRSKGKSRRWPWIIGAALLLFGLWHLASNHYGEEEKALRRQLRETVKQRYPEQTERFFETFGLFYFEGERSGPIPAAGGRKSAVLVHGLDDPGKVWMNLAPALAKADFDVLLLHYPNDQPIVESARLFFEELKELGRSGIHRIHIVAHSMGGLVSREMLTSPELAYVQRARDKLVPEVASLTMVGTPNHGSQLARLRVLAEVRDQLIRLQKGKTSWLGAILDGAGEAKIDLLPGSRFLTELNARFHPEGLDQLTIAGVTAPWSESDVERWLGNPSHDDSEAQRSMADTLAEFMISMTNGLGDGLVTVESTRLEGVPHRTVSGTHLSMIRNLTEGSRRIPPAVPIIVDRLKAID
jgi:pimeloyl-ACP methyl ester carboxylesterase